MARRGKGFAATVSRSLWMFFGTAIVAGAVLGILVTLQHALTDNASPGGSHPRPDKDTGLPSSLAGPLTMPEPYSTNRKSSKSKSEPMKERKRESSSGVTSQTGLVTSPPSKQDKKKSKRKAKKDIKTKQGNFQQFQAPSKRIPGKGARVAVIIPFRDREHHLVKFKAYWRWFANVSATVQYWDVYVAEQFDLMPFNRGWCFNIGLAVAIRLSSASPEIKSLSPPDFKIECAVIQDIDYLPEEGVDYASCAYPTQLSSEIDRFNWGVPYPHSAGGIVGMTPRHWEDINGFSNDYFGWGAEDDELYLRLKQKRLLAGGNGDIIKRPSKGHGRFSGKFMHSMNHTKRITDNKAYQNNLKLLNQMQKGSDRWTRDGLSSLAFRLLDYDVDDEDTVAYGITYYHLRAKRGSKSHELSGIPFAVPSCKSGLSWVMLGKPVPFDLESLRERAREASTCPMGMGSENWPVSFLLVNRTSNLAKIFDEKDPQLLMNFYRSLESPSKTGLIIADPRPQYAIKRSYGERKMLWAPTVMHNVCRYMRPSGGYTYKLYTDLQCHKHKNAKGMVWEEVTDDVFAAHVSPIEGREYEEFCYAGNKKREVQRIKQGAGCAGEWKGLTWENEKHLYVRRIGEGNFCVGTWYDEDIPISRIMPQSDCKADGFAHDFSFTPLDPKSADQMRSSVFLLCVGKRKNGNADVAVATQNDCKRQLGSTLGSFPVWIGETTKDTETYDVCEGDADTQLVRRNSCKEEVCCPEGSTTKFAFSLPRAPQTQETVGDYASEAKTRRSVCVSRNLKTGGHLITFTDEDCSHKAGHVFTLEAPSLDDIAFGLITVLQEGLNCPTFLCADTLSLIREMPKR